MKSMYLIPVGEHTFVNHLLLYSYLANTGICNYRDQLITLLLEDIERSKKISVLPRLPVAQHRIVSHLLALIKMALFHIFYNN